MDRDQHLWRAWAESIHRWGIGKWVATFLESIGPIAILGAQLIYLAQPAVNLVLPDQHLLAAARLMEDEQLTRSFIQMLQETDPQ